MQVRRECTARARKAFPSRSAASTTNGKKNKCSAKLGNARATATPHLALCPATVDVNVKTLLFAVPDSYSSS